MPDRAFATLVDVSEFCALVRASGGYLEKLLGDQAVIQVSTITTTCGECGAQIVLVVDQENGTASADAAKDDLLKHCKWDQWHTQSCPHLMASISALFRDAALIDWPKIFASLSKAN